MKHLEENAFIKKTNPAWLRVRWWFDWIDS